MKKLLLLIPFILLSLLGYSQEEGTEKVDTTKITLGNSTITIVKDNEEEDDEINNNDPDDKGRRNRHRHRHHGHDDWMTITADIGMAGYLTPDNDITLPDNQSLMDLDYGNSRTFSFYFMFKDLDLVRDRIYLTPGIGTTYNSYHFKNNINISTSNDSTTFSVNPIENDLFKLRTVSLEIPLILGLRIGNLNRPLGLQFGVIGGAKIRSFVKEKYKVEGSKNKNKIKDDFNINPFKVDAVARITIGNLGLFGRYSLTSFFEEGKGAEVYPFSIGLTVGSFKSH